MEFKAEVNLEYDDFLAWNKVYAKTSGRKRKTVRGIMWLVLAAAMLSCIVFLIMVGGVDATVIACIVLFVFASLVMLFKNRINARTMQKMYLKGGGTDYLCFDDEAIFIKNSKGEAKYFYSGFTAFYTDGMRYYLLVDDRHAHIVPVKSFVEGNPAMFPVHFCEKTGLEMKEIKC